MTDKQSPQILGTAPIGKLLIFGLLDPRPFQKVVRLEIAIRGSSVVAGIDAEQSVSVFVEREIMRRSVKINIK